MSDLEFSVVGVYIFFFFLLIHFLLADVTVRLFYGVKIIFTEFSQKGFIVLEKGMMKFLWLRLNIVESYFFLESLIRKKTDNLSAIFYVIYFVFYRE